MSTSNLIRLQKHPMLSLNYLNDPAAYGSIHSDILVCLFYFVLLLNNAGENKGYILVHGKICKSKKITGVDN